MTLQIIRKKCSVCNQVIYLDPNVITPFGNRIPLNSPNGSRHDPLHAYVHKKALELRLKREYEESLNVILEESEQKEII